MRLVLGAADVTATQPGTLVVDDDRVQCANADFTTIQDAVRAASSGETARVCAGVYGESVTVAKPLTLRGRTRRLVRKLEALGHTVTLENAT